MTKCVALAAAVVLSLVAGAARASEPDGLVLPKGFHATVVAESLGSIRHMAIRDNGDIYISTSHPRNKPGTGIIALRPGPDGKAAQVEHFSTDLDFSTGIRIYKGALYVTSPTSVVRFALEGNALVPAAPPQTVVDGMTKTANHALAFDGKGGMYVTFSAGSNICPDPTVPKGSKPVGLKPCPDLAIKGGIWRFDDAKPNQAFSEGEHFASGIRDSSALDWRAGDALYVTNHGRDGMHAIFPDTVSAAEDDVIADEMFRVEKGAQLGWPYTYYDGARNLRLDGPEYGGDGKTPATGDYARPVAAFALPRRPAITDLTFYNAKRFPGMYRGGAFLALHGGESGRSSPNGQAGYSIAFVPFKGNKAGKPTVFADGFAGPLPTDKTEKGAAYRPVGVSVGADGALYVADSAKGRIWRIAYTGKP